MHKFPLRRRDLTKLLTENGFTLDRIHGSHYRYAGLVDGVVRYPEVDQGIDEYPAESHRPLAAILSQLGFFDDDRQIAHAIAWERFYAGERRIARKAQVQHRPWNDAHWEQYYGRP